jgi:hypothetical protein
MRFWSLFAECIIGSAIYIFSNPHDAGHNRPSDNGIIVIIMAGVLCKYRFAPTGK